MIPALQPRDESGHQFVFYGDCCSGIPGATSETNFAAVNAVVQQLTPSPEFLCFLGDHIEGDPQERNALLNQWRYWLQHEMAWLAPLRIPIHHITSNHDTGSPLAEAVWREVFPGLPQNGPHGQEGLSYWARHGNLLLVCTNSAYSGLGGTGHVESTWLNQVLTQNDDAQYKLVLGHYPVFPVNGYEDYPTWRIVPQQGVPFWEVLVRHHVLAYLCSHVIAFDVQAHEGVLQITSAGAGTFYGPGNFMPGQTEYLHTVQAAVDLTGMRYQVIDTRGAVREVLSWPLIEPGENGWEPIPADTANWQPQCNPWSEPQADKRILCFRFDGTCLPCTDRQTLLCAWEDMEGPPILWIGLERGVPALTVSLVPEPGGGAQTWTGPTMRLNQRFSFELAIHTGMGPGGVLYRANASSPWSSLLSTSARGASGMAQPEHWVLSHARSGLADRPFLGDDLRAAFAYLSIT
jgi:hypothetical protein